MRTVKYQGDERLVHYGDPDMEMQRDRPDRREAFLTRHSCDTKKDPFAPGFWACYDWQNTDEKSADMKSITQPLKVVDSTEDTLTLEGYVAIYGDETHKDFDGEWFHEGTTFDSGYTKVNSLIVDWEHGHSPDVDEMGGMLDQPGRHDPLGRLDWTTARKDNVGILARAVLNRREWYVRELVEPLAMAGLLGGSSEAIPGKVVKSGGRIDVWPLMRYALTVTPADPRQITDHQIQLVKSLANRYPALKALTQAGQTYTIAPGVTTRHLSINPTLQGTAGDWADATTFVIQPGLSGVVIKATPGDSVSIETQTQPEEAQAITAETQEGELLQTGGAPVTATPEDETGMDELTEGQENILWEQVEALLRAIQEMKL